MLFRHVTGPEDVTKQEGLSHIWLRGPELPEDVVADGLLTAEDQRDLLLDHIARTCEVVVQFQILKRA